MGVLLVDVSQIQAVHFKSSDIMNQEVASKIQKHVLKLLPSIRTDSKASEHPARHGSSSLTDASYQGFS
jgi:hypothetical protein